MTEDELQAIETLERFKSEAGGAPQSKALVLIAEVRRLREALNAAHAEAIAAIDAVPNGALSVVGKRLAREAVEALAASKRGGR